MHSVAVAAAAVDAVSQSLNSSAMPYFILLLLQVAAMIAAVQLLR